MRRFIGSTCAAIVLCLGVNASANAMFINGSISFSDGLDTISNIVSDLTVFDIGTPVVANGGTGDLAGLNGMPTVQMDFDINNPGGNVYVNSGFVFTLQQIVNVQVDPLSCNQLGTCTDAINFNMTGVVSGPGFDPTAWVGEFTANGSCAQAGSSGRCQPGTLTGSWSNSITALGREIEVPTPGTVLLLGLGLLSFSMLRRRRAQ